MFSVATGVLIYDGAEDGCRERHLDVASFYRSVWGACFRICSLLIITMQNCECISRRGLWIADLGDAERRGGRGKEKSQRS